MELKYPPNFLGNFKKLLVSEPWRDDGDADGHPAFAD